MSIQTSNQYRVNFKSNRMAVLRHINHTNQRLYSVHTKKDRNKGHTLPYLPSRFKLALLEKVK